jgi:hypothetical protein
MRKLKCKAVTRETITVPAGTFNAFKVEASGWTMSAGQRITITYWIDPDRLPKYIVLDAMFRNRNLTGQHYRNELQEFTLG